MADHELSILLEEMEGLGVLQRLPTGGYTLRSPNVVPLMGTGTDIEGVLGKDRELPPTFDPATFRARPLHDASSPQRHPLTFEQERILRRERNRVWMVSGSAAGGIDSLQEFLRETSGPNSFRDVGQATDAHNFILRLKPVQRRASRAPALVVVPAQAPWNGEWLERAEHWVAGLGTTARSAQVVFLASPQLLWALPDLSAEVPRMTLRPWSDAFLRQWLDDLELPLDAEHRTTLNQVTGNWSALCLRWHAALGRDPTAWRAQLDRLEAELATPQTVAETYGPLFGLDIAAARQPLRALAREFGTNSVTDDDLELLAGAEDIPLPNLRRAVDWALAVGNAHRAGPSESRLDPVVARVLAAYPQ